MLIRAIKMLSRYLEKYEDGHVSSVRELDYYQVACFIQPQYGKEYLLVYQDEQEDIINMFGESVIYNRDDFTPDDVEYIVYGK